MQSIWRPTRIERSNLLFERNAQRQGFMSERIQTNQAKNILGVSKRSVQNFAAQGLLPSAAQIGRCWTFDEAELRRHVLDRQAAALEKASRSHNLVSSRKKTVERAPSHGRQASYEQVLGLNPDRQRRKHQGDRHPTQSKSKPKKDRG